MPIQYASGPIIIEDDKILLVKEQKADHITHWLFPGGKMEEGETPEQTCIREVKEELGIDIKIIKPLKTIKREKDGKEWILYHFLCTRIGEIKPGHDIVDWGWFDIDNLPPDCSPNVYEIIKDINNNL